MALPNDQIIKKIIEGDTKELVKVAEELGENLESKKLTTSHRYEMSLDR